jgi:hypothetical protein
MSSILLSNRARSDTGGNTYNGWVLVPMFHQINIRIMFTGESLEGERGIHMVSNLKYIFSSGLLSAMALFFAATVANGQTISSASEQEEVATVVNSSPGNAATPTAPVFKDYRGISLGMSVDDVRAKLDGLNKGEGQDFLVLSERESAQIYYDKQGKVIAISIDYFGGSNAPAPDAVLGAALQAKADGSMYQLNRYADAGYWVSYNRTAGDKPIVTITIQKM